MLFNVYISDIPNTKSHQYGYFDDDFVLRYSHKLNGHIIKEAFKYFFSWWSQFSTKDFVSFEKNYTKLQLIIQYVALSFLM